MTHLHIEISELSHTAGHYGMQHGFLRDSSSSTVKLLLYYTKINAFNVSSNITFLLTFHSCHVKDVKKVNKLIIHCAKSECVESSCYILLVKIVYF